MIFEDRVDHIVDVLRWSSPNEIGKCWSTWKMYCDKIDWISEVDIAAIIHEIQYGDRFSYRKTDDQWLKKLKKCKNCTDEQKKKITALTE